MNIIQVDTKHLEEYKPNTHSESKLYLYYGELLKIILPSILTETRKETIKLLHDINHPNCVTPLYGVSTNWNSDLDGYGMKYYNYPTLYEFLQINNLSLQEKRKIAHRICAILKDLEKYDYIYSDIHTDNILIQGDDIKLIDMDCGYFKKYVSETYDYRLARAKNYLAHICYQILIGLEWDLLYDNRFMRKRMLLDVSTPKQKEFLMHVFGKSVGNFEPEEYIDLFSEDDLLKGKEIITL